MMGAGRFVEGSRCPACGGTLLSDGKRLWCSFVGSQGGRIPEPACTYGIDQPIEVRTPSPTAATGNRCVHEMMTSSVTVNRIANDAGVIVRYQADVTITCEQCSTKFRFIGLPAGLDLNGAAVSVDGCEGRFAIAPKGEVLSELEGTPIGFTVKRTK